MNFYCSLKIVKEREQKRLIFEKTTNFTPANNINQTVKQIATLRYNYKSPQNVEFHPLLRASRDHSTLQP